MELLSSRLAVRDKELMKLLSAVIVTDYELGSDMGLLRAEIVADCKIGI